MLIVDDNPSIRRILRNHLTRNCLEICGEAENGEEAIKKARELRPSLVVLDLAMPRVSGYVAACGLKKILPDVRIILLTMYSDAIGRTFPGKGFPADAVIAKGDGITKLTQCVQDLLKPRPTADSTFKS